MIDLSNLPNPQNRALELIKEVATEKGCRPFLVGGPVRDVLLDRQVLDIDLTLEDGVSTLARGLARRVEGRVRSFPQFLTYKVVADDLPEIDIATARKERYRNPGSLPTVTAGRLKDDLLRCDFSINAMAVDLRDGVLHDPSGGEADLQAKIVRVLHERSFIDDPTRIFRALRLAARLGFALEASTETLLREAIANDALSTISRERVWRELFLAMDEIDAPAILNSLYSSGAIDALFGDGAQAPSPVHLEDIRKQLENRHDLDRYVLYTSALLRGSDPSAALLEGSGFSQKRARNVLQIARDLGRFEAALSEAQSDRHRFRLYKRASPEMLSILASRRPDENDGVARYHDYQRFKLPLRGTDLEVPSGPHIARALERTREAVFTGEIPADQARTFARAMAIQYLSREQPAETR